MPSQIAHLVFAVEVISRALPDVEVPTYTPWLGLGAQGPDLFYHNRRRRPSALEYGALLHRQGYGTAVGEMVAWAREQRIPMESTMGSYLLAFATHAVLDRVFHPYINYRSGWGRSVPADPGAPPFQLHPWLERALDVVILERQWKMSTESFDTVARLDCGSELPSPLEHALCRGMRAAAVRRSRDTALSQRLRNAYRDAMGFYHVCNQINRERYEALLHSDEPPDRRVRWISLLHPPYLPPELDVANDRRQPWYNPCDFDEASTETVDDLWTRALSGAEETVCRIAKAWSSPSWSRTQTAAEVTAAVGDTNLSDGRTVGRPCRKRNSAILPIDRWLAAVLDQRTAQPSVHWLR